MMEALRDSFIRSRSMRFRAVTFAFAMAMSLSAIAATDIFIKFDGLDGDSVDVQYKNFSDVVRFNDAFINASSTDAGKAGCVVSVEKVLDRSSPALAQAAIASPIFARVQIAFRKAGPEPITYYLLTLTNALVQSVQQAGDNLSAAAETVVITFSRAEVQFTPQKPDGSADGSIRSNIDCSKLK